MTDGGPDPRRANGSGGAAAPPPADEALPRRGFGGICLASLGVLVFEVALTRILSVTIWYHFAFVVISLAMLGLAVAGIFLYFVPPLVRRSAILAPWACRLAGASAAGALVCFARTSVSVRTAEELFSRDVAALCLVALAPFLFAGLAISSMLARHARQASTLYFADLAGAGLGCVAVVAMLEWIGAPATVLVAAAVFFAAARGFRKEGSHGRVDAALAILVLGLSAWAFQAQRSTDVADDPGWRHPFEPRFEKGRAGDTANERALFLGWNSHSRVRVTEPAAPSDGSSPVRTIEIDGTATTGMLRIAGQASPETAEAQAGDLRTWIAAPPYAILPERPNVLVIGPGGGREILTGLLHRATVTAVEINGLIVGLMTTGPFAEWSGHVYGAPGVTVIHDEARSWVRRTERRFDLIQATLVDTWAATSSGAFALSENALYTVEAFDDFFGHLTDDGVFHVVRWHREPPRESLRAVALMTEVMRRRGIPNPERHIVVGLDAHGLRDGGRPYSTILWSRSPLTPERLGRLVAHARWREERAPATPMTSVHAPGAAAADDIGRFLTSPDRRQFIDDYPYDVRPTTDDRPFFFSTVRLRDVALFRSESYENEQAVVVLVTVLATVFGILCAAFLLPLLLTWPQLRRTSGPGTAASLVYFCALGGGFMLVEIPLLQRFGLYLGHPVWALSTVLAALLTSTGLGSSLAGWWFGRHHVRGARIAIVLVIAAIMALVFVVPRLLAPTLAAALPVRIGVTVALVFPLGILMGFPLPLGIRALASGRRALIPWAWGMNGAASVLASVLAVVIGIDSGFTVAILVGAGCYAVAFFRAPRLPGNVQPVQVRPASVE